MPGSRRRTGERRSSKTAISRRLCYVLRHAPDSVGLSLDAAGWVDVDELLTGLARAGTPLSRADLDVVVRTSDKQRFAYDASGSRIRANQGHSVPVDLNLEAQAPPAVLYHGTDDRALDSIRNQGLTSRGRHHVHLSADVETATAVGARRGSPVVLAVDAAAMAADGMQFYRSANGVWLVQAVPARYLTRNTAP